MMAPAGLLSPRVGFPTGGPAGNGNRAPLPAAEEKNSVTAASA